MIDLHTHILPGVDDGARTLQDSVAMVRELAEQGVTDVVATPHYVEESIFTSSCGRNARILEELKAALKDERIAINLHLGNEIYINRQIADLISAREITGVAEGSYLLVELPMSGDYQGYEDIFLELKQDGYKVILAHPERYAAMQKDYGLICKLADAGVLLQCNLGSVFGQYGKHAQKTVLKLARDKLIFGMGSDIHRVRGRAEVLMAIRKLRKYYDESGLEQILIKNPKKCLENL